MGSFALTGCRAGFTVPSTRWCSRRRNGRDAERSPPLGAGAEPAL